MDWPDDDFEAFLRQFRPFTPKPLPRYRWNGTALAAAAIVVAAVVVPTWYALQEPMPRDVLQTPYSTPPATSSPGGRIGQGAPSELQRADAPNGASPAGTVEGKGTPSASDSPPVLQFRDAKPLGAPRSNEPVGATSRPGTRRLTVGGAVRPPIKVFDVRPIYPEDAQAAGIQGVIILGVVIGEDGAVIETAVLRSIPELDQAASDAVRQWRFEPTLLNGQPVEIEMNVTVQFTLR